MSKVVLLTGASRGIGRATGELLAQNGYRVFGTSRNPSGDIGGMKMLPLDVTDDESVMNCVNTVLDDAGTIDVLINNAGISVWGSIEETSLDEARRIYETNVFGVMRTCQAVLATMRKNRSGLIINVSSLAGIVGTPFLSVYASSKHAVEGYTESLRFEVKDFGICAVTVQPDNIKTDIEEPQTANRIDDYTTIRDRAHEVYSKSMQNAPSPDIVAKAILKIVKSSNPTMRYPVGEHWYFPMVKRFLPPFLVEYFTRDEFKMNG